MQLSLGELARYLDADLQGDAAIIIDGVDTLKDATAGKVSFLANPSYRNQLAETRASAVIVAGDMLPEVPCAALVVKNPYLSFCVGDTAF